MKNESNCVNVVADDYDVNNMILLYNLNQNKSALGKH